MPSCEKCWSDAYTRSRYSGRDQGDCYSEIIEERKKKPCTPEQQAGNDAKLCSTCNRKTVHQYAKICLICGSKYTEQVPDKIYKPLQRYAKDYAPKGYNGKPEKSKFIAKLFNKAMEKTLRQTGYWNDDN